MTSASETDAWLELGDNATQWARLREAIELGTGFSLLFVVVANIDAEALAVAALRELADELGLEPLLLDVGGLDADAPVQRLLDGFGERPLALLPTLDSAVHDQEAFERCFAQLNARRDQITAQLAGPLVTIIRIDVLRRLVDIAPDLFSVHTAQFQLSSTHDGGRPAWLILPHEELGLLGVDTGFGPVDNDGMPNYLEAIPEVPSPLLGREVELGRLRTIMARRPQRVRVWGARGVGKSVVIAAVVREFEDRYERVLWIHGWAAHTVSAILGAIVRALDEHGRCPADPVDIEARYRELTRAQRVLIVVEVAQGRREELSLDIPPPASASLLIEECGSNSPNADATIEIGPLSDAQLTDLWTQTTVLPMPSAVSDTVLQLDPETEAQLDPETEAQLDPETEAQLDLVFGPGFRQTFFKSTKQTPRIHHHEVPRLVLSLVAGRPALMQLFAHIWNAQHEDLQASSWLRRFISLNPVANEDRLEWLADSWVGCEEIIYELNCLPSDSPVQWSRFRPTIPVRFLHGTDISDALASGVGYIKDKSLQFHGCADAFLDFWDRGEFLTTLLETEQPYTSDELEFERRGLRIYTLEGSEGDDVARESGLPRARERWLDDWSGVTEQLAHRAFLSLPADEREFFASGLAQARNDEAFIWIRCAVAAAVVSGQLGRAQRLLSIATESRLRDDVDRVWLANTTLFLSLMPPTEPDSRMIARLLFESEPEFTAAHPDAAALARVRHGLSHEDDRVPLAIEKLNTLLTCDSKLEDLAGLAQRTAHPQLYEHFLHAHLCMRALRRADWTAAKRQLECTIESAHTWGLAVPLLRARLLALEVVLATGDLEPAALDLEATLTRCDQILGPLHSGTLSAAAVGTQIHAGLGQLELARDLADQCRRRLRYASGDSTTLNRLADFYERYGPAEIAASLRARMT